PKKEAPREVIADENDRDRRPVALDARPVDRQPRERRAHREADGRDRQSPGQRQRPDPGGRNQHREVHQSDPLGRTHVTRPPVMLTYVWWRPISPTSSTRIRTSSVAGRFSPRIRNFA